MASLYIAADHRGHALGQLLIPFLQTQGYDVHDLTPPLRPDGMIDFPMAAQAVAREIEANNALGVLVCGSGIGVTIAANRFKGVRAGVLRTPAEATTAKAHTHLNIACLGADTTNQEEAQAILIAWLQATADQSERRLRRLAQMDAYGS